MRSARVNEQSVTVPLFDCPAPALDPDFRQSLHTPNLSQKNADRSNSILYVVFP
jgi:hypothetical protein